MDIKKLEKATKIYERIRVLDGEIIEIEKNAMLVANGETKSGFELKIENLAGVENSEEDSDDKNDSGIGGYFTFGILGYIERKNNIRENKNESIFKSDLSVNSTMAILGVLLHEKQHQRQILISKLEKMGVLV